MQSTSINATAYAARAVSAKRGSWMGKRANLWNISYDGILRLELPDGCFMIGYGDDIALAIIARNVQQAPNSLSICMLKTSIWMKEHGLSLAAAKTEIVMFTRKQIDTVIPIRIDEDTVLETKRFLKYLGIILDTKLNYWEIYIYFLIFLFLFRMHAFFINYRTLI